MNAWLRERNLSRHKQFLMSSFCVSLRGTLRMFDFPISIKGTECYVINILRTPPQTYTLKYDINTDLDLESLPIKTNNFSFVLIIVSCSREFCTS